MDNPETLATLGTQDTGQRLEKTKGAIKNEQSRDTGHIGYKRHRTMTNKQKSKKKQQKTTTQKTKTMSSTSPRRSLGFSQQIKLAATKYN